MSLDNIFCFNVYLDCWDKLQPPRELIVGLSEYRKWMDGCLFVLLYLCTLRPMEPNDICFRVQCSRTLNLGSFIKNVQTLQN